MCGGLWCLRMISQECVTAIFKRVTSGRLLVLMPSVGTFCSLVLTSLELFTKLFKTSADLGQIPSDLENIYNNTHPKIKKSHRTTRG